MLRERELHYSRRPELLGLGAEAMAAEPEAGGGGQGGCPRGEGQGLDGLSAVEAEEDALGYDERLGGEVVLLRREKRGRAG